MALTQEQNAAKEALANEMASYVHSVRIEDENRMPFLVGSCVLLRVSQRLFALTAAHVLDENVNETLFIVTPNTSVILEGQKHTTLSAYTDHRDDPIDVGVLQLDDPTSRELQEAQTLTLGCCDALASPLPNALYFACGFPHTKNRRANLTTATVQANRFKFFSKSLPPDFYQDVNRNVGQHFVVGFDKRHVIQDNRDVTAPHPHGVSGGALWTTIGTAHRVLGILTDWFYPEHHVDAIGAIHIRLFLRAISEKCPELQDEISPVLANR